MMEGEGEVELGVGGNLRLRDPSHVTAEVRGHGICFETV